MPTAQANDVTIYYESHGSGDPLLLIGGLGSDITLLRGLVGRLARLHLVIAYDNRGSGRSDKPDVPYTIALLAEDAAGVLDALGIEQADIVGISMGGKIALELAASRPHLVGRLVLISTSAAPRQSRMTMSVPMRLAAGLNRIGLLRGPYPQPEFAHKRQREASDRYDAVGKLSQVSAPTLIAHGHRDKTTPLLLAEQLQAGITDSELAVFRGGHMFFLFSERRRLIDRIESFLGTAGGVRIRGPRLLLRPFRPIEIDDEWQAMLT